MPYYKYNLPALYIAHRPPSDQSELWKLYCAVKSSLMKISSCSHLSHPSVVLVTNAPSPHHCLSQHLGHWFQLSLPLTAETSIYMRSSSARLTLIFNTSITDLGLTSPFPVVCHHILVERGSPFHHQVEHPWGEERRGAQSQVSYIHVTIPIIIRTYFSTMKFMHPSLGF